MDSSKIYYFQKPQQREKIVTELSNMNSTSGTEFISYYVKQLTPQKVSKIRKEINESKAIKLKKTQKAVEQSLDSIYDALCYLQDQKLDEGSCVVFAKQDYCAVIKLPDTIAINKYYCGKAFELGPLLGFSTIRWGLCVMDGQEVTIGVLENFDIKVLKNFHAFVPAKIKAGGQSQQRFELTRKKMVQKLIDQVSDTCNSLFKDVEVSKLLLGGIIPTTELFYGNNRLLPYLKNILTKPTSVCYTNPKGLQQLVQKNRQFYQDQLKEYFRQKTLFDRIVAQKRSSKWYTKDQLKNLSNYKIVEVVSNMGGAVDIYCPTCVRLQDYNCGHQKETLPPQIYNWFSSNSKYGIQFKKNYESLYKIINLD